MKSFFPVSVWKLGLTIFLVSLLMSIIYLLYVQIPARVCVMRDADNMGNSSVGEKLCKHKYSSYPYCYGEITTEMSGESFWKRDTALVLTHTEGNLWIF